MRTLNNALNKMFRAPKHRAPDTYRKEREAAKPLIAKLGIQLEKLPGGGFNVWPPKALGDKEDPFDGDHYAIDWEEVLKIVKEYEQLCATEATS